MHVKAYVYVHVCVCTVPGMGGANNLFPCSVPSGLAAAQPHLATVCEGSCLAQDLFLQRCWSTASVWIVLQEDRHSHLFWSLCPLVLGDGAMPIAAAAP